MSRGFVGLFKIELPSSTAYICDGGFIEYDGRTFKSSDDVLGVVSSLEPLSEGAGDDIPALDIQFMPPAPIAFTELTQGSLQGGTITVWLAEYDSASGAAVVRESDLQFIGVLDQPVIRFSQDSYGVAITAVPQAEWMFQRDTGNGLSPAFHKSLYPGETGHDNATGLGIPSAWGTASPPTTTAGSSSGAINVGGGQAPTNFQAF